MPQQANLLFKVFINGSSAIQKLVPTIKTIASNIPALVNKKLNIEKTKIGFKRKKNKKNSKKKEKEEIENKKGEINNKIVHTEKYQSQKELLDGHF